MYKVKILGTRREYIVTALNRTAAKWVIARWLNLKSIGYLTAAKIK